MPGGGVLCCGSIVLDILVRPVDKLVFNTSLWVDAIDQRLGGNGASTSYALGVLGVPVRLIGVVGRDPFGEYALSRVASAGCDTSAVAAAGDHTATSVVIVNAGGDRMLLHRPGVSAAAFEDPFEFVPPLTNGIAYFHLANFFALPRLRRHAGETVRRARTGGLVTSIDTGWDSQGRWMDDLRPCLPSTDILFVNADEARMLTGESEAPAAARVLRALGARTVVVKLGAGGCLVVSSGLQFTAPAHKVPVIDTTGAGDCFAGGFLSALYRDESLEEAARFANAVAALNIQSLGATEGVRGYRETLEWGAANPAACGSGER